MGVGAANNPSSSSSSSSSLAAAGKNEEGGREGGLALGVGAGMGVPPAGFGRVASLTQLPSLDRLGSRGEGGKEGGRARKRARVEAQAIADQLGVLHQTSQEVREGGREG